MREMPVSADTLQLQLDYSGWASQRLLDVAETLRPEELTRDFKTADKSVLGTLVHIYAAESVWLSLAMAEPGATFGAREDRDLAFLQTEWPALYQRWKQWLRDSCGEDVARPISFQDMNGRSCAKPAWQVVLHLVNHATHHRGQVSGFLRAMGQTPPPLDLMHYYLTR